MTSMPFLNSAFGTGRARNPHQNAATGGTVATYTDGTGAVWQSHYFSATGTFTVQASAEAFQVVGGGGGGGSGQTAQGTPGGRGGNGVGSTVTSLVFPVGSYTVTIGAGGPGAGIDGWGQGNGGSGGATTLSTFSAAGGGGGHGPGDQNHPQPASIGSPDGPQASSTYYNNTATTYGGAGAPPGPTWPVANYGGVAGSPGNIAIRYRIL